jgi:hypothetical protein
MISEKDLEEVIELLEEHDILDYEIIYYWEEAGKMLIFILTVISTILVEALAYTLYCVITKHQEKKIRENLPSYMRYYR